MKVRYDFKQKTFFLVAENEFEAAWCKHYSVRYSGDATITQPFQSDCRWWIRPGKDGAPDESGLLFSPRIEEPKPDQKG